MIKPLFALLAACGISAGAFDAGAQGLVDLRTGVDLSWPTTVDATYQLQWAPPPGGTGPWNDLGAEGPGDGSTMSRFDPVPEGARAYHVIETIPPTAGSDLPANGGFELGTGTTADDWSVGGSQPPTRSGAGAHTGAFSMRGHILNVGATPAEGLGSQSMPVTGGQSYDFSFWANQVSSGPSYVQQYRVQWRNAASLVVGSVGLTNFTGGAGAWAEVSVPGIVAPVDAVTAVILFRFVTGAVDGGFGEVLIDDVMLDDGNGGSPGATNTLPVASEAAAELSWPTITGVEYQPEASFNLIPASWTPLSPMIVGDGGTESLRVALTSNREFFRVESPEMVVLPPANLSLVPSGTTDGIGLAWEASPTPGVLGYRVLWGVDPGNLDQSMTLGNVTTATVSGLVPGQTYYLAVVTLTAGGESDPADATVSGEPDQDPGIVALFNSSTPLEPATTVDTPTALITYVADRARDRHAREGNFAAYDHYLPWYWEERTMAIEIIDEVAKGGTDIIFNYTTLDPLGAAEFRTSFRGITTVAEYHNNQIAALAGPNQYTATVSQRYPSGDDLEIGDRIEIEISMFLAHPANGRNNYYGTTILYIVGQGIVPWAEGQDLGFNGGIVNDTNQSLDSYPLPGTAWLGGQTTLPYQYSNEPEHRFKQLAGNIAPINAQPFMLGRRLHHTDFGDGSHSEAGNPAFNAHSGKLGPQYIARSCVACHNNNGRALPPALGAPMLQTVVKIGSDAAGSPHPTLGSVLQPQSTGGPPEGSATIASYTLSNGLYGDGTGYELRAPNYTFTGPVPSHFSVRLAPPLVGLGLLEAVSETAIMAIADPNDSDGDGISGRVRTVLDPETGDLRMGRFTGKAGQARLSHQIAAALNTDMGVATAVFPILDGETTAETPELAASDLDEMTRYVALLGVGARRDLDDTEALAGEQLFATAGCVQCHVPDLTTSPLHPMTELRNQAIHPYTDLLLHDMGPGLSDNMGEGDAAGSEWRTPPLWGIGLTAGVSGGEAYLHDGRARTLGEAILWHGGEAEASKETFRTMPAADRDALIKFLKSL